MASPSLNSTLAAGTTGGAAFFAMQSFLEYAFGFRLRRFCTVGLAWDTTNCVVPPAFAVTCMIFFLSDPQPELQWRFCFHWPVMEPRSVAPSFDGPPGVPCAFAWVSSRQKSFRVPAHRMIERSEHLRCPPDSIARGLKQLSPQLQRPG